MRDLINVIPCVSRLGRGGMVPDSRAQARHAGVRVARRCQPRRLLSDRGRRDEAQDLPAPVYGWFTEGFATPDLKEAKALIEALNAYRLRFFALTISSAAKVRKWHHVNRHGIRTPFSG